MTLCAECDSKYRAVTVTELLLYSLSDCSCTANHHPPTQRPNHHPNTQPTPIQRHSTTERVRLQKGCTVVQKLCSTVLIVYTTHVFCRPRRFRFLPLPLGSRFFLSPPASMPVHMWQACPYVASGSSRCVPLTTASLLHPSLGGVLQDATTIHYP